MRSNGGGLSRQQHSSAGLYSRCILGRPTQAGRGCLAQHDLLGRESEFQALTPLIAGRLADGHASETISEGAVARVKMQSAEGRESGVYLMRTTTTWHGVFWVKCFLFS